MPARIRLQRRGRRNDPYYLIVIQSDKKNPRGRVIEKTGYYYPDRWNKAEKQVILNRPRLKYWLGAGAEPTKGIIKLFGKIGFLPKRPPPFGTHTLYQKPTMQLPVQEEQTEETKHETLEDKMAYEFNRKSTNEKMKKEIHEIWEKYNRMIEAFDKKYPEGTNKQRIALMNLFQFLKEEEPEVNAQTLADQVGMSLKDAEDVIESYQVAATPFTNADLEDFKADLSVLSLKKPDDGVEYTPTKNPNTPDPDFDDESQDHLPHVLFENTVKPKPTTGPYGARFNRSISYLSSPLYLRFINLV